jgi:hypothetical protein
MGLPRAFAFALVTLCPCSHLFAGVLVLHNDANGHHGAGRSYVVFPGGRHRRGSARAQSARPPARSLRGLPKKRLPETGVCLYRDAPARPPRTPAYSGPGSARANQRPSAGRRRRHSDRRVHDPAGRSQAGAGAPAARHSDSRARSTPESRRSCPPVAAGSPRGQLNRLTVHRHRPSRAAASTRAATRGFRKSGSLC